MDEYLYTFNYGYGVNNNRVLGVYQPSMFETGGQLICNFKLDRFLKFYPVGTRLALAMRLNNSGIPSANTISYNVDIDSYPESDIVVFNVLEKSIPSLTSGMRYDTVFKDYAVYPKVTTFELNPGQTAIRLAIANQPVQEVELSGLAIVGSGNAVTNFLLDPNGKTITLSTVDQIGATDRVVELNPNLLIPDSMVTNVVLTNPNDSTIHYEVERANLPNVASDLTLTNLFATRDATVLNHTTRIGDLETSDVAQNGRLDAVEALNVAQNGRLDTVEATNVTQNSRLDAIDMTDTLQNGRLDGIDILNTNQNNRLDGIDILNTTQNNRLNAIELVNATQTTNISALDVRLTADEVLIADNTLRSQGLEYSRIVEYLEPNVWISGRNAYSSDFTNIFTSSRGAVDNGSSFVGATVVTNSTGKRALKLPFGSALKWSTAIPFTYNLGCTFVAVLGDMAFAPTSSLDWVEFWTSSTSPTYVYANSDRYLYGTNVTNLSNITINGDSIGGIVSTPELEGYGPGVYNMIIMRSLGNIQEWYVTKASRALTPNLIINNPVVGAKGALNYFGLNGTTFPTRSGPIEILDIFQWNRALSNSELDFLRLAGNGMVSSSSITRTPVFQYPKVRLMCSYTPSNTQDEGNEANNVFELNTRAWTMNPLMNTGGTLNTTNGLLTVTKLGYDTATTLHPFKVTAMTSRADTTGARLNLLLYINGVQSAELATLESSSTTGFYTVLSLKKNDTLQLRYQSAYGSGGNANGIIINRAVLTLEEI